MGALSVTIMVTGVLAAGKSVAQVPVVAVKEPPAGITGPTGRIVTPLCVEVAVYGAIPPETKNVITFPPQLADAVGGRNTSAVTSILIVSVTVTGGLPELSVTVITTSVSAVGNAATVAVRVVPVTATVTRDVLLEVAVYGATPPDIVYVAVSLTTGFVSVCEAGVTVSSVVTKIVAVAEKLAMEAVIVAVPV